MREKKNISLSNEKLFICLFVSTNVYKYFIKKGKRYTSALVICKIYCILRYFKQKALCVGVSGIKMVNKHIM